MREPAVLIPVIAAITLGVVTVSLVSRWSAASGWSDRHRLALGGGALLGHSLLWGLTQPHTWRDRAGVGVLCALTVGGLWVLARQIRTRTPWPVPRSGASC